MKKFLLGNLLILMLSINGYSNPGDTTWVQVANYNMNNYGTTDFTVALPNGSVSYRKILYVFTLGTTTCTPGSTYCHQWDYTILNYLFTHTDSLEIARLITPYANTGVPRFPTGWTQRYIYDITDYYHQLKDTVTFRINYSGYSFGFSANVKIAFIEGVRERDVYGIDKLWDGYFTYGNAADPIANHIPLKVNTVPASTQSSELKYLVTGHGSDNNQCCEFLAQTYTVNLNGTNTDQHSIWKPCGTNELYPQGGTWIYDRANWCPGEPITVLKHNLSGLTPGSTYSLVVNYPNYTSNGAGGYAIHGHVIHRGGFNHVLDASLDDVIAPSAFEWYFRENPSGDKPTIIVHNSGSDTITSLQLKYWVKDSVPSTYNWSGSISPLSNATITLPALNTLLTLSTASITSYKYFIAKILSVNGIADEDSTNNTYYSKFKPSPNWTSGFTIQFTTNNEGATGLNANPSETSWELTDMSGNILYSRTNVNINTVYKDTIYLPIKAFYKIKITDLGCDGLQWWVWTQNPSYGVTAGSFFVKKLATPPALINMNGYTYGGTFGHDFGCEYVTYFTTNGLITKTDEYSKEFKNMYVFPNPTNGILHLMLSKDNNYASFNGKINILDINGKQLYSEQNIGNVITIDVSGFSSGTYFVSYEEKGQPIVYKKFIVTN